MKNINKLKKGKKINNSIGRKEIELECFKRITAQDIPLNEAVDVDKLKKTLTKPESTERDRVVARILLNHNVQKTICELKEKYGIEFVETFLKDNMSNIRKNSVQRLNKSTQPSKSASSESDGSSEDEAEKPISKSKKRKIQASKKEVKEVEFSVDSFFMKPTGENYLASVKSAAPVSSDEGDGDEVKRVKSSKGKTQKLPEAKHIKSNFTKTVSVPLRCERKPAINDRKSNSDKKPQPVELSKEPDIHPSWKAKSLMKPQIQAFQGTKIKFDE